MVELSLGCGLLCTRSQVGKSSKEMDSLLLKTALDAHTAERGAAMRVASRRHKDGQVRFFRYRRPRIQGDQDRGGLGYRSTV